MIFISTIFNKILYSNEEIEVNKFHNSIEISKEKLLLLGHKALAQGTIADGMSGIYAIPGTPSAEITEYVQKSEIVKERNIHRVVSQRKNSN